MWESTLGSLIRNVKLGRGEKERMMPGYKHGVILAEPREGVLNKRVCYGLVGRDEEVERILLIGYLTQKLQYDEHCLQDATDTTFFGNF